MAARAVSLAWTSPPFAVSMECFKGEDVLATFTRNSTVDITGWTLAFNLKRAHNDASALLTITPSLLTPLSGIFTVALSATQTGVTMATPGRYPWDIWRTDSGSYQMISYGFLNLLEDVRI